MNKLEWLYREMVHRLIVKYLISCAGAFHHDQYGVDGKYVVLMSDARYHQYQNLETPIWY